MTNFEARSCVGTAGAVNIVAAGRICKYTTNFAVLGEARTKPKTSLRCALTATAEFTWVSKSGS
jgi:hypothetical protein